MPVTELKAGITVWNSMASNGQSIQPRWSNSTSSQSPSRKWDRNALPFCKASLLKLLKPFANTIWFSLTVSRQSGREHLTWRWGAAQPTSLATAPSTFPSLRWSLLIPKSICSATSLQQPTSPDLARLLWTDRITAQQYSSLPACAQIVPLGVWQHFWLSAIRVSDAQLATFLPVGQEGVSSSPAGGYESLPGRRLTRQNIKEGNEAFRYVAFFFFFLPSSMTHIGFKNSPLVKSLTGVHCTNVLIHAEFGPKFHSQSTAPRNGHFIPVFLSPPKKLCI